MMARELARRPPTISTTMNILEAWSLEMPRDSRDADSRVDESTLVDSRGL